MGLGDRGRRRIQSDGTPTVADLFKPTEALAGSDDQPGDGEKRVGRPKGATMKPKTFTLPLELNKRLRHFAFEHECKEVDVVRAALEAYLDVHEDGALR